MRTPPRIVSLVPSGTEILALLGAGDWLVGRSHECDFPPPVKRAPVLTAPTTAVSTDPAEIDRQVGASISAGESLYRLDTDLLRALRPDIIVTQDLCRVCSIDLATVRRIAEGLAPRPEIVSLNPTTMEGVLDDILTVGAALSLERAATDLVVALRERLSAAQDRVNPYENGPVIAFLEWTDPLFVAGHWTVQLLERAGARHPLNPTVEVTGVGPGSQERAAGASIRVSHEALIESRPERLVICPCGLDLASTRRAAAELAARPWFSRLPAAHGRGTIALVDGNEMFNRPGPRLVDAFEWLVGWLHACPQLIQGNFPWEPAN